MKPVAPVSVVIVSWNSESYLGACLTSLRHLERPPKQVIVIDNASTDGSVSLVREQFPEVEMVEAGKNLGYCVGNNVGFRKADQPFVLALNPDTELEPRYVESLLPLFEDPRVGLASGKLLRFDRQTLDTAGQELGRSRQPKDRGYGEPDRGQFDQDAVVFGACGAAALYRREMLEAVRDGDGDYFDPEFFAFFEDLDLAWRARRNGWIARYTHRAVGYHARGGSADRQHRLSRWASILSRNPGVRYHILKNRFLTMLRNDSVAGYLASAPFIWGRDLASVGLLLLHPSLLARLWRDRRLIGRARRLRKLDSQRPKHQVDLEGVG